MAQGVGLPEGVDPQPKTLGSFGKSINSALILVAGAFATALIPGNDGVSDISTVEIVAIVIAALRGVLVIGVLPQFGKIGEYLPLIITAALGALSQLMASLDESGFQGYELIPVIVTFLSALGSTYFTSDAVASDAVRYRYTRAA